MDSISQLTLGAAVGEAILGRKVGNRAILWGAIGGTIPDLDILASPFLDAIDQLIFHRGMSHSIVFSIIAAPIFGWLVYRLYKKSQASWKAWSWLFFGALFTHPLLDCFTMWGTQLFWPFSDYRVALNTVFIVDPLYTVPFLISVAACLFISRERPLRQTVNRLGLVWCCLFLSATVVNKVRVDRTFKSSLERQGIEYRDFLTNPTPLNNLLWYTVVEREHDYLLGFYSFFDSSDEISFQSIEKQHDLLHEFQDTREIRTLNFMSKGYYVVREDSQSLRYNDIRFGLLNGWEEGPEQYVFSYIINEGSGPGSLEVKVQRPDAKLSKGVFLGLFDRIKGV